MIRYKYPSIPYSPYSPGATPENSMDNIMYLRMIGSDVVITEKMDGMNMTLGADKEDIHARSLEFPRGQLYDLIKRFHAAIRHRIPERVRLHGEAMEWKHSIYYDKLPSYFLLFGVSIDRLYLSWDSVAMFATMLGISTVPVLYEGMFMNNLRLGGPQSVFGSEAREGYVVRKYDEFEMSVMDRHAFKWVREGHVQPGIDHWSKNLSRNRVSRYAR